MATTITGFGARGNDGVSADGWDVSYRGALLVADQTAQIVPTAPITGESVKMFSGWPAGNGNVNNASLVRNTNANTVTLREYSWTLDRREEDTSTTGNRNHALQDCNVDWENGKWHIIGASATQRFGFGSPHANNRNSVTGRIVNSLFQCENVRFVLQLPGIAGGVMDRFQLDDFTYGNARADVAFNQGTLIDGIETGTGDGTADTENGNYLGLFTDSIGLTAPTVLTNEIIRREDNGSGQPAQQFWYSPKTTPLYSVDPTFRLRQSDGTFTDATVETHSDITTWLLVRGSSSTNTGQQAQTNSGWSIGFTLGVEPVDAFGGALSGTYWLLDEANNAYSGNEYQITGVTDSGTFTSNGSNRYTALTLNATTGVATGEMVYSITDEAVAASRTRTSQINFVDNGTRELIAFVDGYEFQEWSNVNPRTFNGVQRPTMTTVNWLKPAADTDHTWNEAATAIYQYFVDDVLRLEGRDESWGNTHVTLGGSGTIAHGTATQSYDNSTWNIGTLVPETQTTNRVGGDLTTITTINATGWNFTTGVDVDLQGNTVNINDFDVTGGTDRTVSNGTLVGSGEVDLTNVTLGDNLTLGGTVVNVGATFSADTQDNTALSTSQTTISFDGADIASGTTLTLIGGGTISLTGISEDSLANLTAGAGTTLVVSSSLTIDGWQGENARVDVYPVPVSDSTTPIITAEGSSATLVLTSGTHYTAGDNLRIVYSRPGFQHIVSNTTGPATDTTQTLNPQEIATASSGNTGSDDVDITASYDPTNQVFQFAVSGTGPTTNKPSSTLTNQMFEDSKGSQGFNFACARLNQTEQVIYHPGVGTTQLLTGTYRIVWDGTNTQILSNVFERDSEGQPTPVVNLQELPAQGVAGSSLPTVIVDTNDSGISFDDFDAGIADVRSEIQDNAVSEETIKRIVIAGSQL